MTYDNFISVHSMTFDLEECVQTVSRYGLHRPTAQMQASMTNNSALENVKFHFDLDHRTFCFDLI